jgi:hypothetical protein
MNGCRAMADGLFLRGFMKAVGNAINTALRTAAASADASTSKAARTLPAFDSFKNDLKKLGEKFPKIDPQSAAFIIEKMKSDANSSNLNNPESLP